MKELSILIKFPSRERPQKFFEVLNRAQKFRELTTTKFLVTLDENDVTMNNDNAKKTLAMWGNLQVMYGKSQGKVDAINRDMEHAKDFDIILLLSDDMYVSKGYDRIITEHFIKHFPDTDGVLWINDGYTHQTINTICCMGRDYYERFGFIYNPIYKSLFCDNEYTDIFKKLNKFHYVPEVLIEHRHPMTVGVKIARMDNLYRRNDAYYMTDKKTYKSREGKWDLLLPTEKAA